MSIDLNNILLTGEGGTLGTQIIKSKLFDNLLTPSKQVLLGPSSRHINREWVF